MNEHTPSVEHLDATAGLTAEHGDYDIFDSLSTDEVASMATLSDAALTNLATPQNGFVRPVPHPGRARAAASLKASRMYVPARFDVYFGDQFVYDSDRDMLLTHWNKPCWTDDPVRASLTSAVMSTIAAMSDLEVVYVSEQNPTVNKKRRQVEEFEAKEFDANGNKVADLSVVLAPMREALDQAIESATADHKRFADDCEKNFSTLVDATFKAIRDHKAKRSSDFDRHAYIIATPEGVHVDVSRPDPSNPNRPLTEPADPARLITKCTAVNYLAEKAIDPTLNRVFTQYDSKVPGTGKSMSRYFGMSTTADCEAKIVSNVVGPKNSGKTTGGESFMRAMGSYSKKIDGKELAVDFRAGSNPKPDLAKCRGVRFGLIDECEHISFATDFMKEVTGAGTLTLRDLYRSTVEHVSELHLLLGSNGHAKFDSSDDAMDDRILPCVIEAPAHRDGGIKAYLFSKPGQEAMLARALISGRAWYRDAYERDANGYDLALGYGPAAGAVAALLIPEGARDSVGDRQRDSNPLTLWIEDCLVIGDEDALVASHGNTGRCTATVLAAAWNEWRKTHGGKEMGGREIMRHLRALTKREHDSASTEFSLMVNVSESLRIDPYLTVKGALVAEVRMSDVAQWAVAAQRTRR